MKIPNDAKSNPSATPTISVVVPVFRAEKFLSECLESVLSQDFASFELILVDDGSPDASGKICDAFAERDGRVRVFHETNGGVSRARKLGVERSRGEWICFVDADDILLPGALSALFAETERVPEADIVEGAHHRFQANPQTGNIEKLPTWGNEAAARARGNVCVDGFEYACEVASHRFFFMTTPWAKIIRRRLLTETAALDLPAWLIHGEDTILCMRMAKNLRRAVRIQTPVYLYRNNPDGACQNPETLRTYTALNYSVAWWNMAKECFKDCDEHWQEVWKIFVAQTFLACVIRKNLNDPALRQFIPIVAEKKKQVSLLTRFALVGTRPPFSLLPSRFFWIFFDGIRTPAIILRRMKKLLK